MINLSKFYVLLMLLIPPFVGVWAQSTPPSSTSVISSIHPIEDPQNHYARLQMLNANERQSLAWMDTIAFPAELYKSTSLTFALVQPHYLTTPQVNFLVHSVQFPANSSVQTRAELDYLLDLQQNRTESEVKRVIDIATIGYWPYANIVSSHLNYQKNLEHLFFECREVISNECTAEKYPQTAKLLQGIMNDMRLMEFAVKYHLLRPRPYQLEPKLEPLRRNQFSFFC